MNAAQAAVYQVGSTLARVEQQIAHQRELSARLQRARDEAQTALAELGSHISGDQQRLDVLRASVADAEPKLERLQADDGSARTRCAMPRRRLADWQQRWDAHSKAQAEAARAGDVERTRIEHLDRQVLDADRRREQLTDERAGLDLDALADAFAELQLQHDTRKDSLDILDERGRARKQAAAEAPGPAARPPVRTRRTAQAGAGRARPAVLAGNPAGTPRWGRSRVRRRTG